MMASSCALAIRNPISAIPRTPIPWIMSKVNGPSATGQKRRCAQRASATAAPAEPAGLASPLDQQGTRGGPSAFRMNNLFLVEFPSLACRGRRSASFDLLHHHWLYAGMGETLAHGTLFAGTLFHCVESGHPMLTEKPYGWALCLGEHGHKEVRAS